VLSGALRSTRTLWWWCAALAIAWALKHHYSVADARDLNWMLRPIVTLLQIITRNGYSLSEAGEWYCEAAGVVLVKACAGINFMIMSFLGWCWLLGPAAGPAARRPRIIAWPLWLSSALVLSWACAVLANTVRILLLLQVGTRLDVALGHDNAHRLIGLAVYLPALSVQLLLAGRERRGRALQLAAALYALLMIVTPLLTGQAMRNLVLFGQHTLLVLACALPLAATGYWMSRRRLTAGRRQL
jgi:exosortase K